MWVRWLPLPCGGPHRAVVLPCCVLESLDCLNQWSGKEPGIDRHSLGASQEMPMSSWNWAPLLWNHPDRDEGEVYRHWPPRARLSDSFKGCCFHLQGRKAGVRKEGKQLFIHLHLFVPLLHSMKGLGGTDKGSWGKWRKLSFGIRLGHTGMCGSATDNVTNVPFSRHTRIYKLF